MISRSTLLHLRIPFSFFLLPIFLFSFSTSPSPPLLNVLLVFFIVHFLLYPASNGYNSYFDKDEESIGGLKIPPKVTNDLYYVAIGMDILALLLGLIIGVEFAIMLFVYGMISKAYSHPSVRIKKFPITSWLVAGIFQGFFTFTMCYVGMNKIPFSELNPELIYAACLSTGILLGSYPMTQIYQHKEDKRRGDITLSIKLGIRGTFIFTAVVFTMATLGFFEFFYVYYEFWVAFMFALFTFPMIIYFFWWFSKSRNPENVNFTYAMRLNMISSVCLSSFFIWLSTY